MHDPEPLGEIDHVYDDTYRPPRFWVGIALAIPLWGLIIAAVYSVVMRMVLLAVAVILIAIAIPQRFALIANSLLLLAVALIIVGIVFALERWF